MVNIQTLFRRFLTGLLFCVITGVNAHAQNPGDSCDPDKSTGRVAQVLSINGAANISGHDGKPVQAGEGLVIQTGSVIQTEAGGAVELAVEDGTADRLSRLRVEPGSELAITGGLYCSDLRPKADGGRWNAREIGIELNYGELQIELAKGVSHSFNFEVNSPNSVARMLRGSMDAMGAMVKAGGLDERPMVKLMEHPKISQYLQVLLMGRDIEKLSPKEREALMQQATLTALSMGLIDLDAQGLMENPQLQSTLSVMIQGRKLTDLPEYEKESMLQMVGAMALSHGLLDPETLRVHAQPDEYTYVEVNAGKMRMHNKHRGWHRDEAVDIEAGMFSAVEGYDLPSQPNKIQ